MHYLKIISLSLVMMFSMAACGGGGSGAPSTTTVTTPDGTFSISPSSLTFNAQVDAALPADQVITLSASQPQSTTPTLAVNGSAIDYVSDSLVNSTTVEVTVRVLLPQVLGEGTHTASIDVSGSGYSYSIPVTYNVTAIPPGAAEVAYVAPSIVRPNVATDVIIRGSGFSRYDNSNLPTVTIGSLAASNISVVNDSELRVTAAPLSVGNHAVAVSGDGTTFTSTASLNVIADQVYTTTSFATTGEKSALIFDKKRQAVYVVNTTSDTLERYTYQSGTSWTLDFLSLSGLADAAMNADGDTLVLIDSSSFYKVDPDAGTLVASTGVTATQGPTTNSLDRVAAGNNGVMYAVSDDQWSYIYRYDAQTENTDLHTFLNSSNIEVRTNYYRPWLFETHDGSKIYFGEHGSSGSRLYQLDTSDDSTSDSGLPSVSFDGYYDVASTPDNSVVLINTQGIYNADLSVSLGTLPVLNSSAVLSPDGNTAYVYHAFNNVLSAYDISNPAVPVQIGNDVNLTNAAGMRPQMRISNDGNTLFIVGILNLNIIDLTTFSF